MLNESAERIRQMVRKEFIQIFRDKRMKAIVFVIPLLQTMVFGYAVTMDVNNIPTAVYDMDRSFESRELVRRLAASGFFDVRYRPESPAEVQDLLDRSRVTVSFQINRGFAADLARRIPTAVQLLVDGTDSNTGIVALDYANRIILKYALDLSVAGPSSRITIDLRQRAWYNPELKSKNYNVPGVIAMVIMLTSLLLTSMAVVREREIGTMEQLMVTPLRPAELILGKTIPFAIIAFFDMVLVTIFGVAIFDIPIRGSLLLLPLSTAIYLLSILGVGLVISTFAKTQQQALMSTFLFYMPAVLLSGFMFPIENMPAVFQYLTYLNPLRYFLIIIRGLFLKGNGIDILWPQIAALLAIGIVVITVSSLRFRKRLA
ncbi:MAG: ABC transporter permease [Nitrospiraceae bacterium]|nr:ABC transporter permease [Nitrospiraceae bacterium]